MPKRNASDSTPAKVTASTTHSDARRREAAFELRQRSAEAQRDAPMLAHPHNDDETAVPYFAGTFTKGIAREPNGKLGYVAAAAHKLFLGGLASGLSAEMDKVPLGGATKLSNPAGAFAFSLDGADSHRPVIPPAPAFHSAEQAGELVEDYWMALLRDIPFRDYASSPHVVAAIDDINRLSDFRGPRGATGGKVDASTLFRGTTAGDLTGPYISQFLWLDRPMGAMKLRSQCRVPLAGTDYMTDHDEWLAIEAGGVPPVQLAFDPSPRCLRNGRDLGEYVHRDFVYQAYLDAALIIGAWPGSGNATHPYAHSANQSGFVTFAQPHLLELIARASRAALKAAWYQKYLVHRRMRPEEMAGRVHQHMINSAHFALHEDLLNSRVLPATLSRYGSYLLPQAYPEGCPVHPSYPAGHAAIAGACVTVIKAFVNEAFLIPAPVEATVDGLGTLPWTGAPLTVGGELNKLASNVAFGRDFAGVHWRSDGAEGLKLGEAVALGILSEESTTLAEAFMGFQVRKFDGTLSKV
jgi:membrane-associated phospholipid phosphatase